MRKPSRSLCAAVAATALFALGGLAFSIPNPASRYCTDLGYRWSPQTTAEGTLGLCTLPDGSRVEEWAFLKGQQGVPFNYCSRKGWRTVSLSDQRCRAILSADCAGCVLPEGAVVEVTTLLAGERPGSPSSPQQR